VLIGLIALVWTRMPHSSRSISPTVATTATVALLVGLALGHELTNLDAQLLGAVMVSGFSVLALLTGASWKPPGRWAWNQHLMLVGAVGVAGLIYRERYVLALCVALTLMAASMFFAFRDTPERIVALAATAGFAIPGMVELVYVVDDLNGGLWERMNTMFKFYNQAWVLLAVAAGVLSGWLVVESFGRRVVHHVQERKIGFSPTLPLILMAGVIAASLAYPITATGPRLETRMVAGIGNETSLNALDWMRYSTYKIPGGPLISWNDDLQAINWLNNNVDGSPVIVEASIGAYRGNGSRFSIATGLPTVLGWQRHEQQQRYTFESSQRVSEIQEFYQTDSIQEKIDFLLRYNVEYVVIGDLERHGVLGENPNSPYSTPEGIAAIESMVGSGLEVAFQHGSTVVYRVILDELTGATTE
jgi:uncharacterized membrane protein